MENVVQIEAKMTSVAVNPKQAGGGGGESAPPPPGVP